MHLFKNKSIRIKLTRIIMMVCLVAMLTTTLTLVVFLGLTFGHTTLKGIKVDAALIADNCRDGLANHVEEDVSRVLKSLRTKPYIVFAGVYRRDRELFASYVGSQADFFISPQKPSPDGWYASDGLLAVYQGIYQKGEKIGTLCIKFSLKPFYRLIWSTGLCVLGVLVVTYKLTDFLAKRLQYVISGPLLELNDAAHTVSEDRDYTVRVPKNDHDELGVLIDSFNDMLEQIEARDEELIEKNGILATEIGERKEAQERFEQAHQQLMAASRRAGMAEIATDVLHSVGNILNSLNLTTEMINDTLKQSKLSKLTQVGQMLAKNQENLAQYLTVDEKGKLIPSYIQQVIAVLNEEQAGLIAKAGDLESNVNHIMDVVRTQQSYAKSAGLETETTLGQLVDNAIQINLSNLKRHQVQLETSIAITDSINVDQQRLLQILVNLISNAGYATMETKGRDRCISIRADVYKEDFYRIEVRDNGIGIPSANLTKIFQHGFTTRDEGHGFGLHGSAIAAKELGGELTVHSDGPDQGATFTLELPLKMAEIQNEAEQLATH